MKSLVGIVAAVFFCQMLHAAAGPQLYFDYSPHFDQQCALNSRYRIDPAWQEEAYSRIGEFQTIWTAESDALMQTLFTETGKTFSRRELSVTLSVCNMTSMSNPFLVNVRRWLRSFTYPNPPAAIHGFADVVYHEFLHNFLSEHIRASTPLLERYQAEEPRVKAHLHLMALQIAVYQALSRSDMLRWVEYFYNAVGGAYIRAWDIVTRIEGHQPFVNEIRAL